MPIIVGGIATSTALNLFIMPALYLLLVASPKERPARPAAGRRQRLRARLRLARRSLSRPRRASDERD